VRASLDGLWAEKLPVLGLHDLVQKMPPVVSAPRPEPAIYNFNLLSATGTGIFLAAIISGIYLGYTLSGMAKMYARTIYLVRYSLVTISCMMAVGFITKYAGTDATLGLALAGTGWAYPFFGTMIGWLGVALTGSDTSSNVLFGGLQRITAEQLNIDPVVMAAANSSGGVMGKMIDAQSIVVASTATKQYGQEGAILRFVFFHSVALAMLVGVFVMGQVYVWPLTLLAPPIR
jgi:lactate permease